MCKPGSSLAPGPAWAMPRVPVLCGIPHQLGILVIVVFPVLPGPASCMSLKPISHVSAAASWTLDLTDYHTSSGTLGGSCHCHQPVPTETLWDSAALERAD